MRKGLLLAGVLVALALGLAVSYAAEPKAPNVSGVLKTVDLAKGMIVVTVKKDDTATNMTFTVNKEKTKVTAMRMVLKLEDLHPGMLVYVTYEAATDGATPPTATLIVIPQTEN